MFAYLSSLSDVDAVEKLLNKDWGYISRNSMIESWICPLCSVLVPHGNFDNGITNKQQHTHYHIAMAKLLEKLRFHSHGGPAA